MLLSVPGANTAVISIGNTSFAVVNGIATVPDSTTAAQVAALAHAGVKVTSTEASLAQIAKTTSAPSSATSFNAATFGTSGTGQVDDFTALAAAVNAAGTKASIVGAAVSVIVPTGVYLLSAVLSLPANVNLVGEGKPVLRANGATGQVLTGSGSNIIANLVLDGASASKGSNTSPAANFTGVSNVTIRDCDVINPTGGVHFTSCFLCVVDRVNVTGSKGHSVYLNGVWDSEVRGCNFQSGTYFGVILTNGCYRNLIQGNRTTANGIELVGVTQDSYENRICNNHAEGTGDNGISITGFKNLVSGNIAKGCQGNGIECYGERNVVVGNTCLNNAKGNAGNTGWRAGIALQGAFGGLAQYNTVTGNTCDDDQATPTQVYGIWLGASAYTSWASGQAVTGTVNSPVYRYFGSNFYKTTNTGTTGATAPTHTTGTVSDGAVSWTFLRPMLAGTSATSNNEVSSNNIARAGTAKYLDASGTGTNEISASFQPLVLPANLTAGQISNAGGLATVALPTGTYSINNGATVTAAVSAPNISGGQQASVAIGNFFLFGFGSVGSGGSGYAVNDIVTLQGGTSTGAPLQLKITAVSAGVVTAFTSNGGSFNYTALPPAGNAVWTGGSGSGFTTTGMVWHIGLFTVTAAGSGYTAPPTVSLAGIGGTPTIVTTTSATMTLSAGAGAILLDGTATKLGVVGPSGAPVINLGATVDGSGVRVSLTATYTVPANTSLVRFFQTGTLAASTVTLPTVTLDGYPVEFNNYAGTITALTFSPTVNGFTNATQFSPFSTIKLRWDATAAAWYRVQ